MRTGACNVRDSITTDPARIPRALQLADASGVSLKPLTMNTPVMSVKPKTEMTVRNSGTTVFQPVPITPISSMTRIPPITFNPPVVKSMPDKFTYPSKDIIISPVPGNAVRTALFHTSPSWSVTPTVYHSAINP